MKSLKKLRVLVLDDDDHRHLAFAKWFGGHDYVEDIHVTNNHGAISALSNGDIFDVVFLDHDLNDFHYSSTVNQGYGWIEGTGLDVAKFIASDLAKERRPVVAVVHSWNPAGAEMMCEVLREVDGITVRRWEFNPKQDPLKAIGLKYDVPRDE